MSGLGQHRLILHITEERKSDANLNPGSFESPAQTLEIELAQAATSLRKKRLCEETLADAAMQQKTLRGNIIEATGNTLENEQEQVDRSPKKKRLCQATLTDAAPRAQTSSNKLAEDLPESRSLDEGTNTNCPGPSTSQPRQSNEHESFSSVQNLHDVSDRFLPFFDVDILMRPT